MAGGLAELKRLNTLNVEGLCEAFRASLEASGARIVEVRPEPATRGFAIRLFHAGGEWEIAFHCALSGLPLPRVCAASRGERFACTLDLTPERGLLVWIAKRLWLADDEVGSPDFDRRFVVRTPDRDAARAFLDPSMKRALIDLLARNHAAHLHARVRPDGLMIEKHGIPEPADVALYLEIFALARGATPEG